MPIGLNQMQKNCVPDMAEFTYYQYITAYEYCEKLMSIILRHKDYFPCLTGTDRVLRDTLIAIAQHAREEKHSNWPYDDQKFREAVNKINARTSDFEDLHGTYGMVTKEAWAEAAGHTVGELTGDTIVYSLGRYISGFDNKGIKILATNTHDYTAELKITAMGDYRFFTKSTAAPYTFNIVRRHI